VRDGAVQRFTTRANIALERFAARIGGNNATNMHGWPGQLGLVPLDGDDDK
jgi:hypothetical protein